MTMPMLGLVGMVLGGPPPPDEPVLAIIDDPFGHDDMAICGGSEDDGTSSEEESPRLLDDSAKDEDCCSTDEEDDCGPGSSCTAGGSCCCRNTPPWQQLAPARWRASGDTGGAPNAAPPPPGAGEADLGAAPPQPQPAAAAAATATAGAAAARPMAIDATSPAEALRQALAEWPVGAKLWYTDTSGGPDLEVTLESVEKVELWPEDEAGRDYRVRMPGGDTRSTVRSRLSLSHANADEVAAQADLLGAVLASAVAKHGVGGGEQAPDPQAGQSVEPPIRGSDIGETIAGVQAAHALGAVDVGFDLESAARPAQTQCCQRSCLLCLWFDGGTTVWDGFEACRDAMHNMKQAEGDGVVGAVSQHSRNTNIKGGSAMFGGMPEFESTAAAAEPAAAAAAAGSGSHASSARESRDRLVMEHYKALNTSNDIHPDGEPICRKAMMVLTSTTERYWTDKRLAEAGHRRGKPDGSRSANLVDLDEVQAQGCGDGDCMCLEQTDAEVILHFGEQYEQTAGVSRGAERRWEVLKAALIACPGVCYSGWNAWLGVSARLVQKTRKLASYFSTRPAHGNTGRPGNRIPDAVIMASESKPADASFVSLPFLAHAAMSSCLTN